MFLIDVKGEFSPSYSRDDVDSFCDDEFTPSRLPGQCHLNREAVAQTIPGA